MTAAERLICETLAERYPGSAAAEGGTPLRLKVSSNFPDIAQSRPDERESFLEAAERLEKDGIVSLVWERFRIGEELRAIVLADPSGLFARIGLCFPVMEANLAREAARVTAQRVAPVASPFFAWLAERINAADVRPSTEPGALCHLVNDLATLTVALARYAPDGMLTGITPRALSVRLFADSKRIERVIEESYPLIRRAERAGVAPPDFSPVGRNYPDTLVAGPLSFHLDDGSKIDNAAGIIIGIPLSTALRVVSVETAAQSTLLAVENKETFYALSASPNRPAALLYVGGHPNAAVQRLISIFGRSGFSLYHAGDLDIEGILILQELADAAGTTVIPVKMDGQTFDRFSAYTRPLEGNALKRAAMIRDDTRALPGIESLLERILCTGRGLEQEVIEYSAARAADY